MATFRTYKCRKCGCEVQTEPHGHYALMSGKFYNFKCSNCKKIVSISSTELAEMGYVLECPKCGEMDCLSTWNPVEGKCPKCGGSMMEVEGMIIMAD